MSKSSQTIGLRSGEKRNFTLIELLIVIAIIAILAGMILPALNSARQKAATAKCVGQMKQVALAIHSYAADSDDFLPPAMEWHGRLVQLKYVTGGYTRVSHDVGLPHNDKFLFKKSSIFVCPSMPVSNWQEGKTLQPFSESNYLQPGGRAKETETTDKVGWGDMSKRYLSYVRLSRYAPSGSSGVLFAEFPFRTTKAYGGVETNQAASTTSGSVTTHWYWYDVQNTDHTVFYEHQGRANLAFSDGHVSRIMLVPDIRVVRSKDDMGLNSKYHK